MFISTTATTWHCYHYYNCTRSTPGARALIDNWCTDHGNNCPVSLNTWSTFCFNLLFIKFSVSMVTPATMVQFVPSIVMVYGHSGWQISKSLLEVASKNHIEHFLSMDRSPNLLHIQLSMYFMSVSYECHSKEADVRCQNGHESVYWDLSWRWRKRSILNSLHSPGLAYGILPLLSLFE